MQRLTILYARNHSLASILLRNVDRWGSVSHCGLLDADHMHVIEARALQGVVRTQLPDFEARYTRVERLEVELPDAETALAFARAQLGKPYDWRAIFGNLLRTSWHAEDAWHCAELVEAALRAGGRARFRPDGWRISPNQSFTVI
jgi:uncharacterized protein YycO